MREITLYTCLYANQLHKIMPKAATAYALGETCFRITANKNAEARFFRTLAEFIQNLMLAENPVVKNSEALRATVKRMVFQKHTILKELRRFFAESDSLHLDGYLQFAMRDYAENINILLYCAIRKNFNSIFKLCEPFARL